MDEETHERAVVAQGRVKAADFLAGDYTLVVTNVPYLGRGKQDETLKAHLEHYYQSGKADLATSFVLRCLRFCQEGGTTGLVTPQSWLFLSSYRRMRDSLLKHYSWNLAVNLGPNTFQDMNWWAATTALSTISHANSTDSHTLAGFDTSGLKDPRDKARMLAGRLAASTQHGHDGFSLRTTIGPVCMRQADQLRNPDARIVIGEMSSLPLLSKLAVAHHGLTTGDSARMQIRFWELARGAEQWVPFCGSCERMVHYAGRSCLLRWHGGRGPKVPFDLAHWQKVAAEKYPNGLPEPESDDPTQWLFHGRPDESTDPIQVAVTRLLGYRGSLQAGYGNHP